MIYRSVRRSAAIVALVLLTLSLVLGTTSVSAKPGGSNSPNAKLCQKGGYTALATTDDPATAFATENACVSYAAEGGTLVTYVPAPSAGCAFFASSPPRRLYSLDGPFAFLAGERVTLVATDPAVGTTGVQISFNGVGVGSDAFPAELSYDIPTDGTYVVRVIVRGGTGNALMDFDCSRP